MDRPFSSEDKMRRRYKHNVNDGVKGEKWKETHKIGDDYTWQSSKWYDKLRKDKNR